MQRASTYLLVVEFIKNATTAAVAASKRILIVFCSLWNSLRREQQQQKICASLVPTSNLAQQETTCESKSCY